MFRHLSNLVLFAAFALFFAFGTSAVLDACELGCGSHQLWAKQQNDPSHTVLCYTFTKPQAINGNGTSMGEGGAVNHPTDPNNEYRFVVRGFQGGDCACQCLVSLGYDTVCTDIAGDLSSEATPRIRTICQAEDT
ncbi:MAG: hypothetical protein WBC44_01765 [Planctomycetaceae bacterium]